MFNRLSFHRFMNDPPLDGRSIDNYANYSPIDPHQTSGIYNKAFHDLTEMPNWDISRSFQVFTTANKMYWAPQSTMREGACGVVRATWDEGYSVDDVRRAFAGVGLRC